MNGVLSTNSNSSSGSNGSSGSAGSSGSTGSSGSASSQSGECDPTKKNYLECLTGTPANLPDHVVTDSGKTSIDEINADFQNRLNNSPVVSSFARMKTFIQLASPVCPVFSVALFSQTISTTLHCDLWSLAGSILSIIMIGVWTLIAFRIFASA